MLQVGPLKDCPFNGIPTLDTLKTFASDKCYGLLGVNKFGNEFENPNEMFTYCRGLEGVCISSFYIPGYFMRYDPLGRYGLVVIKDTELTTANPRIAHIQGLPMNMGIQTESITTLVDQALAPKE